MPPGGEMRCLIVKGVTLAETLVVGVLWSEVRVSGGETGFLLTNTETRVGHLVYIGMQGSTRRHRDRRVSSPTSSRSFSNTSNTIRYTGATRTTCGQ